MRRRSYEKNKVNEETYKKNCMEVKFSILSKSEEHADSKTKKAAEYGKRRPYSEVLGLHERNDDE